MKASELITLLQDTITKEGDHEIMYFGVECAEQICDIITLDDCEDHPKCLGLVSLETLTALNEDSEQDMEPNEDE